ncbi:MAG: lamin tail domain-containing protein, partial [Calditrichia bacterium]|nr:lamin tail domain-containing protein [Calditrichia bacterium]
MEDMRKMKWLNKSLVIGMLLILSIIPGFSQDHVLISEVVLSPTEGEFIELYNPTGSAVDLSQYHLADFKQYHELTSGMFSSLSFGDFCVSFPGGSTIASGATIVVAVFGDDFQVEYGIAPDFEIVDSDGEDSYADMLIDSSRVSSSALANSDEMLILFKWDGSSEVVQDVDYVIWGDNTDYWVDKSGIGTYLNDTPVATQAAYLLITSSDNGYRLLRDIAAETGETLSGGNGLTGHDETSEHFSEAFLVSLADPNPGTFGFRDAVSGDGHASMTPAATEANREITINIKVWGDVPDPLDKIAVTIPENWDFSQGNVSTSGDGFTGSSISFDGNTILIENAAVTGRDTGTISIANTFAEGEARTDTFKVATAVNAETPVEIATSPVIAITPGITPIGVIQENETDYLGQTVKIRGVVVIGSGVLRDNQTNVYIVDDTGAGIEIFNFTYEDGFLRGDSIEVTGVIGAYSGVTQIADYVVDTLARNRPLPKALSFTTGDMAGDTDTNYEGYWITMTAPITDKYYAGGGWNTKIDDGTGEITIRTWDTSNLNLE